MEMNKKPVGVVVISGIMTECLTSCLPSQQNKRAARKTCEMTPIERKKEKKRQQQSERGNVKGTEIKFMWRPIRRLQPHNNKFHINKQTRLILSLLNVC